MCVACRCYVDTCNTPSHRASGKKAKNAFEKQGLGTWWGWGGAREKERDREKEIESCIEEKKMRGFINSIRMALLD